MVEFFILRYHCLVHQLFNGLYLLLGNKLHEDRLHFILFSLIFPLLGKERAP